MSRPAGSGTQSDRYLMSNATKAVIILIFSIGLVLSYPAMMYPPIRRGARRLWHALGWPLRAARRARTAISELPDRWRHLRGEVERLARLAERREEQLNATAGRMLLETQLYTYKPSDLIRNADRNHGKLADLHAELKAKTFGAPVTGDQWFQEHEKAYRHPPLELWWQVDLWFSWAIWKLLAATFIVAYALPRRYPPYRLYAPGRLNDLLDEWRSLTRRQALLRTSMEKIPEKTRAYDEEQSAKDLESRQREAERAMERPIRTAEVALAVAKGYVHRLRLRRRHAPTKGSAVLVLEPALMQWQARIAHIEHARSNGTAPQDFIQQVHSLERDMSLAGTYAVKVVDVEQRAQLIHAMHKRLKRRWRGLRMPDDVIKSIMTSMRRDMADLWASSRWDELDNVLDFIQKHIAIYQSVILSRVWHLQAGTFQQLVDIVFRPEVAAQNTDIRFSPEIGEPLREAASGSNKSSPFAERLREHTNGGRSQFSGRG